MRNDFRLRPIERKDNPAVAAIIRKVMPEFKACGPGFAIHDREVDEMFESYTKPRAFYLVLERENNVIGGAGIAPLQGGDAKTCELRKMYFLPEARGLGFGKEMLGLLLEKAKDFGFERCYLETLKSMETANHLYKTFGFEPLKAPLGNTGHFSCDAWYAKKL